MNIDLYRTSDAVEVVHKSVSNKLTLTNVELVRYDKERDTMTVTVVNEIDLNYNYANVNGKWYYIKPIINEYDFATLELTIDPLKTYSDAIGECMAEINRANNKPNYYINDGFFKTDSFSNTEYIQGWTTLGTPSAYIVTTGA